MKRIAIAYILVACCANLACNSTSNKVEKLSYEDSLQSLLFGSWGNPGEHSPVWKIDKDSIYFIQDHKAYSYRLEENNVVINKPGYQMEFKDISFIKDTIYFYGNDGGGVVMACRFKNNK